MVPFDAKVRPRNPNALTTRNLFVLGLITLGLISCAQQSSAQPPLVEPTPINQPAYTQPPLEIPIIATQNVAPTATPLIVSPTPEIFPTATPFILNQWPSIWPTVIDDQSREAMLSNNAVLIDSELDTYPDQAARANEVLPGIANYVWNISFALPNGRLDGGTLTPISTTGEYLTANHFIPQDFTSITLRQPSTGREFTYSPDQLKVASSDDPRYSDIAVIQLPTESGIEPIQLPFSEDCVTYSPPANTPVYYVGFPFFDTNEVGPIQYKTYFGQGLITPLDGYTCVQVGPQVFISTNLPAIKGSSGGLAFRPDGNGGYVISGLLTNLGPGGGLLQPSTSALIQSLQVKLNQE